MGFTFHHHGKKRDVDAEKHLKRLHKTVPFIESPLQGADHDQLVFSQRHEANTVELFFDLFFVANLATFTTYHSITSLSYLVAYIGFFGILWSCWFQVTLHDVRFARDSIYERVCKAIQFIVFVGLALVGSSFNPTSSKANNTNFRILCYTLVISRGLLAIQYCVVLFYTSRAKFSKLNLPLGLMIGLYVLAGAVFGAMTPAFKEGDTAHHSVYMVWYIVMLLESVAAVAISSIWRMLSFKKTHLMERMSLLTLIVIGEGAIGVTKTVSRLMGKYGLEFESCALIMAVIGLLLLLWALYFDNFPHGHYGTIRQQIWSLLHFPFQLAIVGLVEGGQQTVLARYVIKNWKKILKAIEDVCVYRHQDGQELQDSLLELLDYWDFASKLETQSIQNQTLATIYEIGNTTGICSSEVVAGLDINANNKYSQLFTDLVYQMFDGVYIGLGMKLPVDKLEKLSATGIALHSWQLVYIYFWSAFCLFMICTVLFMILIRRHRADAFDFVSIGVRLVVLAVGGGLIALIGNETLLERFLSSPAVLLTCVGLLYVVLFFDRMSAKYCNWKLRKTGEPYAVEYADAHQHGGHGNTNEHGEHASDAAHHESMALDHLKPTAWSMQSDTEPLTGGMLNQQGTAYYGAQHSYALPPLKSPPTANPPPTSVGDYAPLGQEHHGA